MKKKAQERTAKTRTTVTAISLKPDLLKTAKLKAAERGYEFSFSQYVADLLQRDIDADHPEPLRRERREREQKVMAK